MIRGRDRIGWYWPTGLAAAGSALTILIWSGLFFASSPHYHCPQDDVGVKRLTWLAFAVLEGLLLVFTYLVATKLRVNRSASLVATLLALLPLSIAGAYTLYGINTDWFCASD